MKTVAIIGAGITGVTTAYALQKRGFDVTLIDQNRYAGMETSFANGGQLSASNAETWTNIGTMIKGLKWMFSPDAPLLMNPTPNWHKYSWMAEFAANVPNYRKNTVATVRMALAAREHLTSWANEAGIDFNCVNRGILHFYETQHDLDHARKVNGMLAEGGLDRREVTPDEMKGIEPTLNGKFLGGFFTESDFTGDIHRYSVGLAQAVERNGGTSLTGHKVTKLAKNVNSGGVTVKAELVDEGVDTTLDFDAVVICAGVRSRALAAQLGDRVNIYPVKGYSITVNLNDERSQASAPWVSLLDDKAKIVTSRLGKDRYRIAGTAEFNGYNKDIRADRIGPLTKWCEKFFPNVNTEYVVPWAGLRPMMPSMLPKVAPGKAPGVFYNTGHGHLGWTLSAATAELIADQVLEASRSNSTSMAVAGQ